MSAGKYVEIPAEKVPANVQFSVPRRHQGQMVEVSYGGPGLREYDHGDPYMRREDRSSREVTYYKWQG